MLIWIALMRPPAARLWGDEGTYVAMTESLVRDHDLVFGAADRAWTTGRVPGPPVTVILQQTDREISYSKPILYPLLSAPLYLALGERGMEATNLLILTLALYLAWQHLRRMGHRTDALWVLASFSLCSVLLPYAGWKMSDLAQAAITLAGLVLALGPVQRRETTPSGRSAVLGGIFIGMAVSMRYPAAAFLAAVLIALVLHRRLRRAALFVAAATLTLLALNGLSSEMIGAANPYKAIRSSFNEQTGYPIQESDPSYRRFDTARATQSATWIPPQITRRTAYSSLYFFIGRHSGLLAYFPIALFLAWHSVRRPSRIGLMMLGAVGTISLFYLVWMPDNYFGGSTFIGNRYFLGAFPALLLALRRLPSPRFLVTAWICAALSWTSALISVASTRGIDASSQSHTRAGVFRLLPFESTAHRIDGLADRFWDEDFVRFVDPFAKVSRWSFQLATDRRPAELLIATDWTGDPLLFLVSASEPSIRLEVSDWGGSREFDFPRPSPNPPGLVEVEPAGARRVHSFWWKGGDKPYQVRTMRFKIAGTTEQPTTAVVRYLGRGRALAPLSAHYLGPSLPAEADAGSATVLRVEARNTGRRPWNFDALLPVQVGFRLVDPETDQVVERGRARLATKVRRGETLAQDLEIQWPSVAGDYELVVELLRGPAFRLGEAGRYTLATTKVRVAPVEPSLQ